MSAALCLDIAQGFLERPGPFVGALRRECIEHVRDRDDARSQRDVFTGQPLRVAAAVEFFVMSQGDDRAHLQIARRAVGEDFVADHRMTPHDRGFLAGVAAGLEQDLVGDADLADVVHGGGGFDLVALHGGELQFLGNEAGVFGHAQDVVAGFLIAVFPCLGQFHQGFAFACAYFTRGLHYLFFQPLRTVADGFLAAAQGQEVQAACPAFLGVDRPGEEIGCAVFQCLIADLAVFDDGDDDDGHIGQAAFGTHATGEFDAVHARHPVIGDDEIGDVDFHPGQRVDRVGVAFDDDAGFQRARQAFEQAARRAPVIHDDHACAAALTHVTRRRIRQGWNNPQWLHSHF